VIRVDDLKKLIGGDPKQADQAYLWRQAGGDVDVDAPVARAPPDVHIPR
jgi:hypothetical protein